MEIVNLVGSSLYVFSDKIRSTGLVGVIDLNVLFARDIRAL